LTNPWSRRITLCIFLLTAWLGTAVANPFFDFYGFNYLDGPPLSVGTLVTVPMVFDPIQPNPALPLDLEGNEYTVLITDLQIVDVQSSGGVAVVTFDGGLIQIFEDPAKNAVWADDPPNAQVPGTFVDGILILGGVFTDCMMLFDLTLGTGTVQGHVDFNSGSRLEELLVPTGWLFYGGVTTNPLAGIPPGYEMAWDPQLMSPETVPTRTSTWGQVRGLFR
jgi:hypothetical protein